LGLFLCLLSLKAFFFGILLSNTTLMLSSFCRNSITLGLLRS